MKMMFVLCVVLALMTIVFLWMGDRQLLNKSIPVSHIVRPVAEGEWFWMDQQVRAGDKIYIEGDSEPYIIVQINGRTVTLNRPVPSAIGLHTSINLPINR